MRFIEGTGDCAFLAPIQGNAEVLALDVLGQAGASSNPSAFIAFRVATSSITLGSGLDTILFVCSAVASIPEQFSNLCHETTFLKVCSLLVRFSGTVKRSP